MGIQTRLIVKEAMGLLPFEGGGTVMFIRVGVFLVSFLHTPPTKVGLIIRAGMLSQIVVGFQAVRAEITFTE